MSREGPKPKEYIGYLLIILVISVVDLYFYYRLHNMVAKCNRGVKEYEELLEIQRRIRELEEKMPPGALVDRPANPDDLRSFFETKANLCGVRIKNISTRKDPRRSGPWQGYTYTIQLNAKDSPITRKQLVDFLLSIERERPFLKTTKIRISEFKVPGGDIVKDPQICITYFNRE
jgi:hypothetical protein